MTSHSGSKGTKPSISESDSRLTQFLRYFKILSDNVIGRRTKIPPIGLLFIMYLRLIIITNILFYNIILPAAKPAFVSKSPGLSRGF